MFLHIFIRDRPNASTNIMINLNILTTSIFKSVNEKKTKNIYNSQCNSNYLNALRDINQHLTNIKLISDSMLIKQ